MVRNRTPMQAVSVLRKAEVTSLTFEEMVLRTTTGRVLQLKRFRYRGVPKLRFIESKPEQLINAGRDEQLRKIFKLSSHNPNHATYMFDAGIFYFRYLDSISYSDDIFDFEIMKKALKYFNHQVLEGKSITAARKV
ncbi:hypothetical protein P4S55_16620 [Shewanella sp. PP-Sp27a-2]